MDAASHRRETVAWFSRNRLLADTEAPPDGSRPGAREIANFREILSLIPTLRSLNLMTAIQAVASFRVRELVQWH